MNLKVHDNNFNILFCLKHSFMFDVILRESLHLAKFAITNIVQVLAQVICKVERSKIHIAKVKKF